MTTDTAKAVHCVDGKTLQQWLQNKEALLVDVREPAEFSAEHIDGARLLPLSKFDPAQVPASNGVKVVMQCKSGMRSRQAADRLLAAGTGEVWQLEGGIEAWKSAGLPVVRSGKKIIDVQRQTQMTIGAGVLSGVLLGAFVSPWFLLISGFMGGGLIFAGLSGTCMLASLIARMPWNQQADMGCGCSGGTCATK